MKLPVDPKMRTQILILCGLGAVVLLVLGYFGLSSLVTRRAEIRVRLESARTQLDQFNREIKGLPALRQSRDDLFTAIQAASTNHILFHEYRNYHLTAREILLPMAAELNMAVDIPKEGTILDFPISEPKGTNKVVKAGVKAPGVAKEYDGPASATFALYPVTVTGKAGFIQLLAFLKRIETTNPYIAVADLSVKADPETPDQHEFTLTLLWPIWKNLELKPKREDLLLPVQDHDEATNPTP